LEGGKEFLGDVKEALEGIEVEDLEQAGSGCLECMRDTQYGMF
jgi:hypothetical protein